MLNFRTKLSSFAMLGTIAVLASFSGNPAFAGSKLCKVDHFHFGVGSVQANLVTAKRDAARAWESFTAAEYGRAWGRVSHSMDASMSCKGASGSGYSCVVKAKPCRDDRMAANEESLLEKMVGLYQR